jgi:hypothetical protein
MTLDSFEMVEDGIARVQIKHQAPAAVWLLWWETGRMEVPRSVITVDVRPLLLAPIAKDSRRPPKWPPSVRKAGLSQAINQPPERLLVGNIAVSKDVYRIRRVGFE